jgi:transcriptional regulator with XRE-family HTH domain
MKELLAKVGWTQAEFARRIETSPNTVMEWCKGGDSLAYRIAVKYLELLSRVVR